MSLPPTGRSTRMELIRNCLSWMRVEQLKRQPLREALQLLFQFTHLATCSLFFYRLISLVNHGREFLSVLTLLIFIDGNVLNSFFLLKDHTSPRTSLSVSSRQDRQWSNLLFSRPALQLGFSSRELHGSGAYSICAPLTTR